MSSRMSAMSVFNSSLPVQSNLVANMDWSGFARSSDVEKAAGRVSGSLDKATKEITRAVTDVGRDSKQITDAVKAGSERVVDAVGKIKNTQNEQSAPSIAASGNVTAPVSAIHRGLMDVSESTACIAEHLVRNPDEMGAATEAAEAVGRRFSELVRAASLYEEGTAKLDGMVGEMAKTMDWVDYKFSDGDECNGNRMTTPPANFSGATLPGVFNVAAIAPPIVGGFNELLER